MTTLDSPAVPAAKAVPAPSLVTRACDVLASEWIKLRSARSTFWTLVIAAILGIGGSAAVALPSGHGATPLDPLAWCFASWLEYPVLAVGVLGVLAFTSEYSSGLIRTTLAAVPRRLVLLAAKVTVVGGLVLVVGELCMFVTFFLSQWIEAGHDRGLSISQAGVLGAVLAAGVVLAAVVLLGVGLGGAIRHTAGAVAAFPAVVYLPLVFLSLPSPWNERIGRFTLPVAAYQVVALHPSHQLFSPSLSILVILAWPAVALVVAGILLVSRDA